MFPDFISGDTLSQCATFFFYTFASARETLSQCSPAPTKEGAHYRSVPPPFFFSFFLQLPWRGLSSYGQGDTIAAFPGTS